MIRQIDGTTTYEDQDSVAHRVLRALQNVPAKTELVRSRSRIPEFMPECLISDRFQAV